MERQRSDSPGISSRPWSGSTLGSFSHLDNLDDHSIAQDIVIPQHLLEAIHGGVRWSVDEAAGRHEPETDRTDAREHFDVQRIAQEQGQEVQRALTRAASISVGAFGRSRATGQDTPVNNFGVSGHPTHFRKTSLAPNWGSNIGSQADVPSRSPSNDIRNPFADPSPRSLEANHNPFSSNLDALPEGKTVSAFDFGDFSFGQDHDRAGTNLTDDVDPATGRSELRRTSTIRLQIAPRPSITRSVQSGSRRGTIVERAASVVQNTLDAVANTVRRSSLYDVYEKAKVRGVELQRKKWVQVLFEWTFYVILLAIIYFVLIGLPLWKGAVYWLYWVVDHKFVVAGTWSVTIAIAVFYAFAPLLVLFEKYPPMPEGYPNNIDATKTPGVHDTALLIPCYKSAKIIGPTLDAALKIFPASHIFVIANGNSPTPLDDTEEVCRPYGVNHIWSPVGSKIVAQFVGCFAAKAFKNVLLIDDDCALPPNFPIVSDRMKGNIKCIGYTIKSVGPESSKGTLCQQAQDLEYKLSGIQRAFAGKIGSATFPHGAISIWNTDFLISTFYKHPGFSVSEDWFFGHVARQLGCRITMCTSVFIETETPSAIFFSSGGSRGGFGEMTIFKQRFMRWNFFFVNGMYYNLDYIFRSWKLGWWELGAKIFVFQEVYETLLYLTTPFILPISFIVRPSFSGYLFVAVFGLYFLNTILFNEIHLRRKNERIGAKALYLYYMPYKVILTGVNVASCYWSLYKYAKYFAKRHPKIIEDEKAIDVVLRLEESAPKAVEAGEGRRMTITAVGSRLHGSVVERNETGGTSERKMTITTLGPRLSNAGSQTSRDPHMTVSVLPDGVSPGEMRKMSGLSGAMNPFADPSPFANPRPSTTRSWSMRSIDQGDRRRPTLTRADSSDVDPLKRTDSQSQHSRRSSEMPELSSTLSRGSGSFRRSNSQTGQHIPRQMSEVDAPQFDELMLRLRAIEERLNGRNIEAVDFAIQPREEQEASYRDSTETESVASRLSKDDIELEDVKKTADSRSMV
ncbi:hypothetical protein H2203_008756 [Taxawa tesnikishii (nom. ined.)]|nr:hypothetical protein H2203_008756 [Dothideales sp. JES 119]